MSNIERHWIGRPLLNGPWITRDEDTAAHWRDVKCIPVEGPFVLEADASRGAVPTIDEEALIRATSAVKAGRMGRASNRAVVLAVLAALSIPHGEQ